MIIFWQKPCCLNFLAMLVACSMYASTQAQNIYQQDTLALSSQKIERRFRDSTLTLLAAHYNVDANKALTEQARLGNNPVLVTDQVLVANGKAFPYGKNLDGGYSGQYFIQLQQLITTAGKRGKLIDLATTNTKISELRLQDVLRNLRNPLHNDYYTLVQL